MTQISNALIVLNTPHTKGYTLRRPKSGTAGRRDGARVLSTPEQKCIGWPEQKYISEAGKKARRTGGPRFRHQAWIGLSAGVSELAGRGRRLL